MFIEFSQLMPLEDRDDFARFDGYINTDYIMVVQGPYTEHANIGVGDACTVLLTTGRLLLVGHGKEDFIEMMMEPNETAIPQMHVVGAVVTFMAPDNDGIDFMYEDGFIDMHHIVKVQEPLAAQLDMDPDKVCVVTLVNGCMLLLQYSTEEFMDIIRGR